MIYFRIKGRILYNESSQAWSTIKIKREIFYIFPQLKDKRSNFSYTMIIPRSYDEFKQQFEELKKDSIKFPILLFFEKEDNSDGKPKNI